MATLISSARQTRVVDTLIVQFVEHLLIIQLSEKATTTTDDSVVIELLSNTYTRPPTTDVMTIMSITLLCSKPIGNNNLFV